MKCIIVEGPQGSGKSGLTNYLRDNLSISNLYRLSGIKDISLSGKDKSEKVYIALMRYMKDIEGEFNLIFDRTFFSDYVYANLGYKDYDFTDVYYKLLGMLGDLDYDIYYISLYLSDPNIYVKRLDRIHHGYKSFSLESSMKQQAEYKKVVSDVKKLKNAHVYEIAMDDFDVAHKKINEIFDINN